MMLVMHPDVDDDDILMFSTNTCTCWRRLMIQWKIGAFWEFSCSMNRTLTNFPNYYVSNLSSMRINHILPPRESTYEYLLLILVLFKYYRENIHILSLIQSLMLKHCISYFCGISIEEVLILSNMWSCEGFDSVLLINF